MDEAWERAVEAALELQADSSSSSSPAQPRTLTLDGAVKCLHGRLPPPNLLEKFQNLEHLSIANVGVSSLEKFPRLRNLQRLILSDNRIAGGLEFLVEAGLDSLRDLDLSNNRIQFLEDLAPLARLRLVSLDLYECPVTRVKDYRSRVFGMIGSLKYLDKMDADENERPESDDEEEEEDDEEDDELEGEDPGSGEVEGEDRAKKVVANGVGASGVVDMDEDEESDADEEETETGTRREANHHSNGFRVAAVGEEVNDEEDEEEEDVDDEDDEEDGDEEGGDGDEEIGEGEEIDEDDGEDEDVVEVHNVGESDEDDDDGVEEDDDDEVDEDEEDVDDDEEGEPASTGRVTSTEGEIDEHEQGEDDENGEIGEAEEQGVEEEDGEGEDEV